MFGWSEDFLRDFFKMNREPEWKTVTTPTGKRRVVDPVISATDSGKVVLYLGDDIGEISMTTENAEILVSKLNKAIQMAKLAAKGD